MAVSAREERHSRCSVALSRLTLNPDCSLSTRLVPAPLLVWHSVDIRELIRFIQSPGKELGPNQVCTFRIHSLLCSDVQFNMIYGQTGDFNLPAIGCAPAPCRSLASRTTFGGTFLGLTRF